LDRRGRIPDRRLEEIEARSPRRERLARGSRPDPRLVAPSREVLGRLLDARELRAEGEQRLVGPQDLLGHGCFPRDAIGEKRFRFALRGALRRFLLADRAQLGAGARAIAPQALPLRAQPLDLAPSPRALRLEILPVLPQEVDLRFLLGHLALELEELLLLPG